MIFKSYTFTWWQIGIFKLALLAIGAAIGAHWHEFFGASLTTLIIIAVIAGFYIAFTWWQIGIFKLALLAIGAAIGAHWHEFFGASLTTLIIIAVIAGFYIAFICLKQMNDAGR